MPVRHLSFLSLLCWFSYFDFRVTFDEPDSIDAIQRPGSTRFRTVEELEGVGVEGEALELLD